MIGLILYVVALLLYVPLTVLNIIAVLIKYGFKWRVVDGYFYQTAIDIDRFGNRNLRTLLNLTMRMPWGYEFGDCRETISSALGKNQRDGTLSFTGYILCELLDTIHKEHCKKSIKKL
jgi:hypothetical protein